MGGHGSGRGKAERDGGKGIGRVVVGGGESKPVRSQPSGFYDPGLPARGDSGCRERGSSEGQSWPISCPWRVRTGEEGAFPSHVLRYSHLILKHFAAIWQCYRPTRPSVTFLLKLHRDEKRTQCMEEKKTTNTSRRRGKRDRQSKEAFMQTQWERDREGNNQVGDWTKEDRNKRANK